MIRTDVTFDKTARTITFTQPVTLEKIGLINDATAGVQIYNPGDPSTTGTLVGLVLTLAFDTSALNNADKIQVFYSGQGDTFDLLLATINTTGPTAAVDTAGFGDVIAQISGGWTGIVFAEFSNDGLIWDKTYVNYPNNVSIQEFIDSNGTCSISRSGQYIRLNVQTLTGTLNVNIIGRTSKGFAPSDMLSLALDKSSGVPLNVRLPVDLKQDQSGALFWADSAAFQFNSAGVQSPMVIDTTGYQSIVFHQATAGIVTPTIGNDLSIPFVSTLGYASSAPQTLIAATTGASITVWPVLARYMRFTGPASLVSGVIMLRETPFAAMIPTNAPVNVAQIGGTNTVNAGVAGVQAIGGNIAAGVAPTANPVVIGGIDTTGLVRRILTDTFGRILADNALIYPSGGVSQSAGIPSFYNGAAQQTTDVTLIDGMTHVDLLSQILTELRVLNTNFFSLGMNQLTIQDDPVTLRSDPSINKGV